jgi:hypothetical protein
MGTIEFARSIRTRSGYRAIMAGGVVALVQLSLTLLGIYVPLEVAPFLPVVVSWFVFLPYHHRTRRVGATWTTSTAKGVEVR